jgi:hypothetical protein
MHRRRAFNPKRRVCDEIEARTRLEALNDAGAVPSYGRNPEHKRNPGDFGLDPPSSPRLGKTLCDAVRIYTRAKARALLLAGLSRGLFSVQSRGLWPQNVWVVTDEGEPLEAQLESDGRYHGYPMPEGDPFREEVLARWERK